MLPPDTPTKPREPIGSAPPLEPRRVPVPVTTAGQWAAMRPDKVPTLGRERTVGGHTAGIPRRGSGLQRVEPRLCAHFPDPVAAAP